MPADRPGIVTSRHTRVTTEDNDDELFDINSPEQDLLSALMKLHQDKEARFKPSLQQEMKDQGIGRYSSYTDIVTKIPLFLAIMKESMRLYPPVGFFLPRIIPSTGTKICDTYLPPESFLPDRWLSDGKEQKREESGRIDAVWPGFGGRSRSFPGQRMGMMFVKKALTRLIEEFETETLGTPKWGP
ncbi:hypothetical protein E8E12_001396 [Didymella heteroderae]|uniref:Uncharacterized protein n=1 Tax=Didymella heteroderae TaxID=1769908 RepID=A0A9P5C660_9PLEO|nr:hypothetical protein E8E12_001396 [Didymella heteroderae]